MDKVELLKEKAQAIGDNLRSVQLESAQLLADLKTVKVEIKAAMNVLDPKMKSAISRVVSGAEDVAALLEKYKEDEKEVADGDAK